MPYKSVPLLLTTWTVCTVCWVPVAHLDQRHHDEWHASQVAAKTPALAPVELGHDGEGEGRAFHGLNHADEKPVLEAAS